MRMLDLGSGGGGRRMWLPRPIELVAIDADPDASSDADPCTLVLSDITPTVIYKGQGTSGSAPALLVIRGNHIVNANLMLSSMRATAPRPSS